MEENPEAADDEGHTHIIKRDKRGRATSDLENSEFEKFYPEEKIDLSDAIDEILVRNLFFCVRLVSRGSLHQTLANRVE